MNENRIRGSITIEFTQNPEDGVHYTVYVDDWVKHWADMNAETMATARVPEAVIAARVLADMCVSGGIKQAMEFAARAVKTAGELHEAAGETGQSRANATNDAGDEQDSTVH